jgi:hypothetical protein
LPLAVAVRVLDTVVTLTATLLVLAVVVVVIQLPTFLQQLLLVFHTQLL